MDCSGRGQLAPAVAAQRLCDLLLQFPAAAIGGVRWSVLARKYEERYGARLDASSLGHSSPLAAAATLLWDVLRLVGKDPADPVLGAEDAVVLTPRPGFIASWPSLYQTLCALVREHGTLEASPQQRAEAERGPGGRGTGGAVAGPANRALLLSQLKPLLQCNWHPSFDENGMGFLGEDGTLSKMRKMKHLVQAVIQWRDQRLEWRRATGQEPSAVDRILQATRLELEVSKRHNDLVLRCSTRPQPGGMLAPLEPCAEGPVTHRLADAGLPEVVQPPVVARCELELELAFLRTENARLRSRNEQLSHLNGLEEGQACENARQRHTISLSQEVRLGESLLAADCAPARQQPEPAEPLADLFDNPFEPPPQREQLWVSLVPSPSKLRDASGLSSACCGTPTSTIFTSNFEIYSGTTTHASMTPISSFDARSGAMTPVPPATLSEKMCALVPMWFSLVPSNVNFLGDRGVIPTGIVEQIRSQFESAAGPDTGPLLPPSQYSRQ